MGHIFDISRSVSVNFGTEIDFKKSQICPIWVQSDPIWMPNREVLASLDLVYDKVVRIWPDSWPDEPHIGQTVLT